MHADLVAAVHLPAAQACFIGPANRPLFAWHHPPPPHARRGVGIVLCPALGYEYMSAFRTWKVLAGRLAAIGFDILRFDYDGMGNSAGDASDPDRVAAWQYSIRLAIAEIRQLSSANTVALVGLRAGGMLALQAAAAAGGVDRLVLWSSPGSGRAYVRELKAVVRLSSENDALDNYDEADGGAINVEGYVFSKDTVADLAAWTPESVGIRPAPKVLLIDRDDRPIDSVVEARLRALGSDVDRIRTVGTAEMLLPPHLSKVPAQALDGIEAWFRDWQISPAIPVPHRAAPRPGRTSMTVHGCRERPVHFGHGDGLFGVVTSRDEPSTAPAVILLNTGGGHHVGPHRLYVPLAREWAARGHYVLRFDLHGIGDSTSTDDPGTHTVYPEQMLDDAREAIAHVRQEAPGRQIILAGLCSGGWLAFQVARCGLGVDGIVSINPPLYLRDGDARWLRDGRVLGRYQQAMRDPSKWVKALRGGASYASFTRVAARAISRQIAVRTRGILGDELPDGLANDLCIIAERRIRTLFVFSRGDDGFAYFQSQAQPALKRAQVRAVVDHLVVEGAGHAFRPLAAQQRLAAILTTFVESSFQVARVRPMV